jgi:hypothetical protein
MYDADVSREIDELERGLFWDQIHEIEEDLDRDDPEFVQRIHRLHRAEIVNTVTVSLLLVVGAVAITAGLATLSWPIWGCGGIAFLATFAVDHHYHRSLRRGTPT